MNQVFNNRELAFGIVITLLFLWGATKVEIRSSFKSVLKAFFNIRILTMLSAFSGYVLLSINALYSVDIWDVSQVKNSIVWFIFVGAVALFGVHNARKDKNYFSTLFNQQFKVIVLIGFLVALTTYSLFTELFLLIFSTVLVGISAYAEYHPEHSQAKGVADKTLAVLGGSLVLHSVYEVYFNSDKLIQLSTFQNFLVPLMLTTMLIPFLFFLAKYMEYEMGFVMIKIYTNSATLRRYAIFKSLILFKGNIDLIAGWLQYSCIPEFESKESIERSIQKYIELNSLG